MASGRISAVVIATRARQVVFERFFDPLSEPEKAEVRAACDQVAGPRGGPPEDQEVAGRFRRA